MAVDNLFPGAIILSEFRARRQPAWGRPADQGGEGFMFQLLADQFPTRSNNCYKEQSPLTHPERYMGSYPCRFSHSSS